MGKGKKLKLSVITQVETKRRGRGKEKGGQVKAKSIPYTSGAGREP